MKKKKFYQEFTKIEEYRRFKFEAKGAVPRTYAVLFTSIGDRFNAAVYINGNVDMNPSGLYKGTEAEARALVIEADNLPF